MQGVMPYGSCQYAEANVNLRHWAVMPSGGHFGPAERPAETVREVQSFFETLI